MRFCCSSSNVFILIKKGKLLSTDYKIISAEYIIEVISIVYLGEKRGIFFDLNKEIETLSGI